MFEKLVRTAKRKTLSNKEYVGKLLYPMYYSNKYFSVHH